MAQQAAGKAKFTTDEVVELLTRRESDISASDISDSTDEPTSEEDPFFDGDEQATCDPDWQPAKQRVEQASSSDEENLPPVRARARRSVSNRGRAKGQGRSRSRSSIRVKETSTPNRWHGVEEPDKTPPQPTFRPSRTPGAQLLQTSAYSALELFQLFFTADILHTLVANSNEYGRAHYSTPPKTWTDISVADMYGFLSVALYMGFVKCTSLTDYWRGGKLYSLLFPKSVMSGRKWLRILKALHLSSAAEDSANEAKRGTPAFDRLGKIKPLYMDMREACRRNYHPRQNIAIDERMLASKARVSFKRYMKGKPVRWGFKLFVLADSSNGYTWDFFIYEGKTNDSSGKGLSYDAVTQLVKPSLLGTGYKLFVDNFYTSSIPDVSDAPIGYYQVLHKTRKWYKTFFYHFLDIAIVNAFLLHKDLCSAKGQIPMCQKAFRETLADQLMQACSQGTVPRVAQPAPAQPEPSQQGPSQPSASQHRLQYISGHRTAGRLRCRICGTKTAVQCSTCDKPLCFVPNRDCYNQWHIDNPM